MSGGSHFAPGALCLEPCWHHGLLISWGKTWTKNTVLLLFVTKQGWYSVKKWVGWRYKCHVRAGEIWFAARRNTTFPQIWWYSVLELKLKSRWKEIWNQAETNPIQRFPKFDGLSQPPSSFEDVFRHFVMNLSDFFWLHSHFSVHGRAHHSFPTSLAPNKSLYLASTFSASPHRGLRHSSQNQKQIQITIWWWDEQPCLIWRG